MHFNWPSVYFTAGAQNLEAQSGAPNSIGAGHNCCKVMRTQQMRMQTFAVRRSDCRHILFTAPEGRLQGKLNPFPLCSSTRVCFEPFCKETLASFPLKQHHTIKLHTCRTTSKAREMLLWGFEVSLCAFLEALHLLL